MKIGVIIVAVVAIIVTACNTQPKEGAVVVTEKLSTVLSQEEKAAAIVKGKEIAQNTFKVLGGNLKKSMGQGGVEAAINYCNANASNLMDSLGTYYNATIRRTSSQLRSENNKPTAVELIVLDAYQQQLVEGEVLKPVVELLENGNTVFYAPINMQPLCVTCHGNVGGGITAEDYTVIQSHYPNDKATGYGEGDFRGIWSIELKDQTKEH